METKSRYTMVNKRGEGIYHSNSFLGFIDQQSCHKY